MNYTEVRLFCKGDDIESLTMRLESNGILSTIIEDQKIFDDFINKDHDYYWDYVDDSVMALKYIKSTITFYLEDTSEGIEQMDNILQDIMDFDIKRVEVKSTSDEDWIDNWKKYFKPVKITDKITVKPSWEEYEQEGDEIIVELDPGMAFGTGTHPTTSMCIKLMQKYMNYDKTRVLDVGCGSGILSIVAARLGAEEVLGIDIDPIAVRVSKENISKNGLEDIISIKEMDFNYGLDYNANIITANLMADLIVDLSKIVKENLGENGVYISSGILIEKQNYVTSAIEENGFQIVEILEEDEWCAIAAKIR